MQLTLCDERVINDPDEETLVELLHEYASEDDFFSVLSSGEQTYMQTTGSLADGFVLEYRDGSAMLHYRCTDEALDLESVTRAFTLYLCGDTTWQTVFTWRACDVRQERDWYAIGALIIIAVCLLLTWVIIRHGG